MTMNTPQDNLSSNPILGLGNDILEIERVRNALKEHGNHFLCRLFTPQEQAYCLKYKDPVPHLAARFSAKESIAKALGTGFGKHLSWLDMEILNDSLGKPHVTFSPKINSQFNSPHFQISISHCTLYVATIAIWLSPKLRLS